MTKLTVAFRNLANAPTKRNYSKMYGWSGVSGYILGSIILYTHLEISHFYVHFIRETANIIFTMLLMKFT